MNRTLFPQQSNEGDNGRKTIFVLGPRGACRTERRSTAQVSDGSSSDQP